MDMERLFDLLFTSLFETFFMVSLSSLFAIVVGFPLGIILNITTKNGLVPNYYLNRFLDISVNILRSLPFVILMVVLIPVSRFIVGTSIGSKAAIIPLSVLAAPFVARLVDSALSEVPKELVETSSVMGASNRDIVFKVLIAESLPSLINAVTITVVNLIGASAMAGAIGGGGIGDLAIRYGYQRFETDVLIAAVIATLVIVQVVQIVGDRIVFGMKKKRGLIANRT